MMVESSLGLCASRDSRTIDVGAGAGEGLVVVADGMGGHCTGWLGARLAVRALVERLSPTGRFLGAADGFPDDWGWAGAMQSRAAAEHMYQECAGDFGDRTALPPDLALLFSAIDKVVANIPAHASIHGVLVGCLAAVIEGARVRGTHVGIGRALVLREGATEVESIVVEHYMHLVVDRLSLPEVRGLDPSQIPRQIIVNGLGGLSRAGVGIDHFDLELGAGDLLFLCSRQLDIPDDELARLARQATDNDVPLDELARMIERRAAATFQEPEAHFAQDVAFAVMRARAR
jgi:serine/threonine protein phosphatase PrpC